MNNVKPQDFDFDLYNISTSCRKVRGFELAYNVIVPARHFRYTEYPEEDERAVGSAATILIKATGPAPPGECEGVTRERYADRQGVGSCAWG